ncbi:pilus assembly protein Flp/PilA [Bosea sp. OAE752]|jgi:pilus assembly protein Flp/PilA|uniref:Flp family type IVb pilin n=1 Tax=unclassified Bosea (in: a-proteobacteria) TaxID=2653178 RepID=UPI000DDB567A
MNRIGPNLDAFLRDERGATAIEYGLIGVLISISIVAGATQVGQTVLGFFQSVAAAFPSP